MSDTIFVQFMARMRTRGEDHCTLANGFSDTYSLCKSKGDFVWIEHSGDIQPNKKALLEEFERDTSALLIRSSHFAILSFQTVSGAMNNKG